MRLRRLALERIGPFDQAELDFTNDGEVAPVTIITGENGTGKTLLLDVVRTMFGENFVDRLRPIERPSERGRIEIELDGLDRHETTTEPKTRRHPQLEDLPRHIVNGRRSAPPWVVDYWASETATGPFEIRSLQAVEQKRFLFGSLSGEVKAADTTQFICQVDYLRDSRNPKEKIEGELLWAAIGRIAELALINGRLDHVARATLTPVFLQHGRELELRHLNAGSVYILQRALGLLQRMYACHALNESEGILDTPGLLLIDEAENHLHPKWQKRFIPTVRELFPNLQIVATTHSPFIVASAPKDAKVFVCEQSTDTSCVVRDVSREYGSLPIDEVLASPVFSGTLPFSEAVTKLVEARKEAIEAGDEPTRRDIEAKLKKVNPDEFGYLDLPDDLRELLTGS